MVEQSQCIVSCDEEEDGTADGVALGTAGMVPDACIGAGMVAETGGWAGPVGVADAAGPDVGAGAEEPMSGVDALGLTEGDPTKGEVVSDLDGIGISSLLKVQKCHFLMSKTSLHSIFLSCSTSEIKPAASIT